MIQILLTFIGFYALFSFLVENLHAPYQILRHSLNKLFSRERIKSLVEEYGPWAAITGSSDGIGRAYALELARRGFNILLISRTEEKLLAVAEEIERRYHIQTKIIVADFSKGPALFEQLEEAMDQLDLHIGLFVNNAGSNTPQPSRLSACDPQDLWNVIYTNVGAVTHLSRYFLHRMRERRIKGLLVNVSSGTELTPLPYAATYAATKAFMRSFTLALQQEARPAGIAVQLLSPDFVVTKINHYSRRLMRGGLFVPDAETYARSAVDTLGKVEMTKGYFWHSMTAMVMSMVSLRFRCIASNIVIRRLVNKEIIYK